MTEGARGVLPPVAERDFTSWRPEQLREPLEVIVHGAAHIVGFGVAAVSVLRDISEFEIVVVGGSDEARQQLVGQRMGLAAINDLLTGAHRWGPLFFLPEEEEQDDDYDGLPTWTPDLDPVDAPDAWRPGDVLIAALCDAHGRLVGILSADLPVDGLRPGPERREMLSSYVEQAGRNISLALRQAGLARQVGLAKMTRDVVRKASAHVSPELLIEETSRAMLEGFGVSRLWVRTFGSEELTRFEPPLPAHFDWPEDLTDRVNDLAEVMWAQQTAWVISADTERPVMFDRAIFERALTYFARRDIQACLFSPMGAGTECVGCVVLVRDVGQEAWTHDEAIALLDIGHDLGRAILTARMFQHERQLVEQLQELDAYRNQVISTVSHELRTPLSVLLGHVELLEGEKLEESGRDSVDVMHRAVTRMTRSVDHLLDLKSADEG